MNDNLKARATLLVDSILQGAGWATGVMIVLYVAGSNWP